MKKLKAFIENAGTVRALQTFQVLRFLTVLFTGMLLSKSSLSIRGIGCYESLIFLSGAVSFFWVSGLMNSLLSSFGAAREKGKTSLLFHAACSLYTVNFLLLLVLLLFGDFFKGLLPTEAVEYYPLLLMYIFLNNPSYLIEHIFLLQDKAMHLVRYGVINLLVSLVAVILPVYLGFSLYISFYALIAFAFLKNIFLLYLLRSYSGSGIDLKAIAEQLLLAAPLIFSLLISGSAEYIDGFLVSTHFGSDAFAVFRYGAKELPIAVLLSGALSNALVPKLAGTAFEAEHMQHLRKESLRLMHLLFPLTIVLILGSTYIYPILFREEFISSAPIFNTYLLLLISRMVFPQTLIMAGGKTGVIFKIALVEILVNVVSSYFLMLQFGIIGVALGTLIAFFTEKLCLAAYLYFRMNIPAYEYIPIRPWLLYSAALLSVYFVNYFLLHHQ